MIEKHLLKRNTLFNKIVADLMDTLYITSNPALNGIMYFLNALLLHVSYIGELCLFLLQVKSHNEKLYLYANTPPPQLFPISNFI